MSESKRPSGPQFHADRPAEQEAVRTTIVGGRPPGSGQAVGRIPRGIEVLVKKASIDPEFKVILLERRAEAAARIGLELEPSEAAMLAAVPAGQLEAIIARTEVAPEHRRAFLGQAAAVMLAAVGVVTTGCPVVTGSAPDRPPTEGIRPDRPPEKGIRPDRPPTKGVQPDQPPPPEKPLAPTGSRPDLPKAEPPMEP
jgi:hypothetical protein